MKSIFTATMIAACLAGSPALAVPSQLLNKTVTVSFTVRVGDRDGQTVNHPEPLPNHSSAVRDACCRDIGRRAQFERVERGPEVTGGSFRATQSACRHHRGRKRRQPDDRHVRRRLPELHRPACDRRPPSANDVEGAGRQDAYCHGPPPTRAHPARSRPATRSPGGRADSCCGGVVRA